MDGSYLSGIQSGFQSRHRAALWSGVIHQRPERRSKLQPEHHQHSSSVRGRRNVCLCHYRLAERRERGLVRNQRHVALNGNRRRDSGGASVLAGVEPSSAGCPSIRRFLQCFLDGHQCRFSDDDRFMDGCALPCADQQSVGRDAAWHPYQYQFAGDGRFL